MVDLDPSGTLFPTQLRNLKEEHLFSRVSAKSQSWLWLLDVPVPEPGKAGLCVQP